MKKGAVLVETRLLPNLMEIIENHLLFLPEDWDFMVFGGAENDHWFKEHFPGTRFVGISLIPDPAKLYNMLLTDKNFWNQIPFDKILLFQHDSRLLRDGIEEFSEWDFIGAPWKFQNHGGNGGLSLRSKAAMLDIISSNPPYIYPSDDHGNEDVWFCNRMKDHTKWKMAPREVCQKFAVESIYQEGTLGAHAIDKYLTPIECSTILNQYKK
jgi:hypothetical protein